MADDNVCVCVCVCVRERERERERETRNSVGLSISILSQRAKEGTRADGLSGHLIYVNHAGRDDEDERDRMGEKIRKVVDRDVRR